MKKILVTASLLVIASQALAHSRYERVCRTRVDRYGNERRRCETVRVSHSHHHHDHDYGEGFFDGMTASSYLLATTSDILDGDDKTSALQQEASMHLAALAEGIELEMDQDLAQKVEELKASRDYNQEPTLEELLAEIAGM